MRLIFGLVLWLPFMVSPIGYCDMFGMDLAPLVQLVGGQVTEIERLTETIGLAKDQAKMLGELNDGIQRTVTQIHTLQEIINRAGQIDPRSIKTLSDVNDLLDKATLTKNQIDALISAKFGLYNQAITQTALQADTSFRMGQEMVLTGSQLADESRSASPGRASQITAASSSASMLAQGIQLQSLSQLLQLQALSLELQKTESQREFENERRRKMLFERQLGMSDRKHLQ